MVFSWTSSLVGGAFSATAVTAAWYLCSAPLAPTNALSHVVRLDLGSSLFLRRVCLLGGLIGAGFLMYYALTLRDLQSEGMMNVPWWYFLIGGLLAGFAANICGGCMLGGVPFGSARSLISFMSFFVAAFCLTNAFHGGWRYIAKGGRTAVSPPEPMAGRDLGITAAVYGGFLLLYTLAATIKKQSSALTGSLLVMLFAGLQLGVGFGFGGLLSPAKVLGAMDLNGTWDPSLWVYTGSSLLFTILGIQLVRRSGFFSEDQPPESTAVTDWWLIIAAVLMAVSVSLTGLTIPSSIAMINHIFTSRFNLARLGTYALSLVGGILVHMLLSRGIINAQRRKNLSGNDTAVDGRTFNQIGATKFNAGDLNSGNMRPANIPMEA